MKRQTRKNNQILLKKWRRWKFKNTFMLLVSLAVFFWLTRTPIIDSFIEDIGSIGYVGAFVAGILFVSTFTVAPAAVVLFHLADTLHPLEVALLAGLGAMVGDYVIFRYTQDRVFKELIPIIRKMHTPKIRILFRSPYFAWILPAVGAFIIASPLPDEVGVSMLGLSKIKKWKFFLLAFALNTVGIFFGCYRDKSMTALRR
jgi:hypothetical protein